MADSRRDLACAAGVALSAGVLAVALQWSTAQWLLPRIDHARAAEQWRHLAEVAPVPHDNDPLADRSTAATDEGIAIYRLRQRGAVNAVIVHGYVSGYAGAIELAVGIDPSLRVLGVRVLEHRETAGVGDRVARDRDWLACFAGRELGASRGAWLPRGAGGDFDAVSGATVTSAAVIRGVAHALTVTQEHRDRVFARDTSSSARSAP